MTMGIIFYKPTYQTSGESICIQELHSLLSLMNLRPGLKDIFIYQDQFITNDETKEPGYCFLSLLKPGDPDNPVRYKPVEDTSDDEHEASLYKDTPDSASLLSTTFEESYSSNEFKKNFENTLNERLVDNMSVKMKSVGAIVSDGVRGTVFRVGSKYVMTALHVVTSITNPRKRRDIPDNDWSKLEEPTIWITFAVSAMDLRSSAFFIKKDCIFMDKELDVAVLELKSGNILPEKLQLSKEMGQTEQVNIIGFGHPTDHRKQLDANCKTVPVTDQLITDIWTQNENIITTDPLRKYHLDPNTVKESYMELIDMEKKFACHASLEHGASGAPAMAGAENEVVGLFVKGLPSYYYELRSRPFTKQDVEHFPNHLRFELCSKTDYIYKIMGQTNPQLAADIFN